MVALRSDVLQAVKSDGMAPLSSRWPRRARGSTRRSASSTGRLLTLKRIWVRLKCVRAHLAKSLYFIWVGDKVLGGKSQNQDTSELFTLVN